MSEERANFRFSRNNRLLKSAEFSYVFAKPVKVSNSYISLLARKNGLKHPRLGLAVAKRQVRKAADRNRLKRLIRESFRHNQEILSGLDIIALVRSSAVSETNANFLQQVQRQIERLKEKCEKL